jgi:trypsin
MNRKKKSLSLYICFLSKMASTLDRPTRGFMVLFVVHLLVAQLGVEASKRIANGGEAELGQFPFVVQICKDDSTICTGTLLTPNMVLTAAHCFFDDGKNCITVDTASIRVRLGVVDVTAEGLKKNAGQVIEVDQVILYPQFDNVEVFNDIAILKLRSNANLDQFLV